MTSWGFETPVERRAQEAWQPRYSYTPYIQGRDVRVRRLVWLGCEPWDTNAVWNPLGNTGETPLNSAVKAF